MSFRWERPPPLCDCLHRDTLLERFVWWLRAKFRRRKTVEFKIYRPPIILQPYPKLDISKILLTNSLKDDR